MKKILILIILLFLFTINCSNDEASVKEEEKDVTTIINGESNTQDILIAFNSNGIYNGASESVGTLPATGTTGPLTKIIDPTFKISSDTKPLIKDLHFPITIQSENDINYKYIPSPSFKVEGDGSTTTYNFNANNSDGTFVTGGIDATLKYTGTYCLIYADDNYDDSSVTWSDIGNYFDNTIYPADTNAFGNPTDVDNNGKVVILYYEMKQTDGGTDENGVLGYFWAVDLYSTAQYSQSNEMEIFYMNVNWGAPDHDEMKRTLAHEFQHMINYGQRVILNSKTQMDTWMNEGLAETAEHIAVGTVGSSRLAVMHDDSNNKIRNGLSLVNWPQYTATDENYALVYTFMEYLRLQASTDNIFKAMIAHTKGDYNSLPDVMDDYNSDFSSFEKIHRFYRIANLLKNSTGIYGYKGEADFDTIAVYPPTSVPSTLEPGGAIYLNPTTSNLDSFTPSGQGVNMRYVKLFK